MGKRKDDEFIIAILVGAVVVAATVVAVLVKYGAVAFGKWQANRKAKAFNGSSRATAVGGIEVREEELPISTATVRSGGFGPAPRCVLTDGHPLKKERAPRVAMVAGAAALIAASVGIVVAVQPPTREDVQALLAAGQYRQAEESLQEMDGSHPDLYDLIYLHRAETASDWSSIRSYANRIQTDEASRDRQLARSDAALVGVAKAHLVKNDLKGAWRALLDARDDASNGEEVVQLRSDILLDLAAAMQAEEDWQQAFEHLIHAEKIGLVDVASRKESLQEAWQTSLIARSKSARKSDNRDERMYLSRIVLNDWSTFETTTNQSPPEKTLQRLKKRLKRDEAAERRAEAREEKRQQRQTKRAERRRKRAERRSAPLVCRDGSYSPTCTCGGSWRGCCSHHGGVAGCGN